MRLIALVGICCALALLAACGSQSQDATPTTSAAPDPAFASVAGTWTGLCNTASSPNAASYSPVASTGTVQVSPAGVATITDAASGFIHVFPLSTTNNAGQYVSYDTTAQLELVLNIGNGGINGSAVIIWTSGGGNAQWSIQLSSNG